MAATPLSIPQIAIRPRPGAVVRFFRHPLALLGLVIILALLFAAFLAPHLSQGDPSKIFPNGVNELGVPHAPGGGFPLGADTLGRDVWTRVLFGARISLAVAFCAMLTSAFIGTTIGALGGFFGGKTDAILTRITEIFLALPTILLAIALAQVLPDHLPHFWLFEKLKKDPDLKFARLLLAIALVTWTGIARAVRGQVLALKEREFVEAARSLGVSNLQVLTRHILPNVFPTVIVLATLATANNILLEAGLSYLGLGLDPSEPSWGGLIADGQPYFSSAPWIVLVPGFAIILAVAGFNLVGNALQEVLEPKR